MIEYINKRLIDWATWVKRRDDGGLGYPGAANFARMASGPPSATSGPIIFDAAAMEIESIMIRIRADSPARYEVAKWVYLAGNFTMSRVASELGCSRDTVYTRLHALHLSVMDEMHENTINEHKYLDKNIFEKVA